MKTIPHDKLLHFFYATLISFVLINIDSWIGFFIALLIFIAKEIIYDKWLKKGTPELLDFIYGAIPAILILLTKIL